MAASLSTERALKQQHPAFSGLPVGLAGSNAPEGGLQTLIVNYISVSRMAELRGLAAPVLLDCAHQLADGIEDVSGLGPLSVRRTEQVVELCWQIIAAEMATAVWAMDLRQLPPKSLGKGTRRVFEAIGPLLQVGQEGKNIFEFTPIVKLVRSGL